MRLIGGKDYYDSALAFGRDEDIVFVRSTPQSIDERQFGVFIGEGRHNIHFIERKDRKPIGPQMGTFAISYVVVIVAGKRYNIVRFEDFRQGHFLNPHKPKWFFDYDSFTTYLADEWKCEFFKYRDEDETQAFFDRQITDREYQMLIQKRVVTAVYDEMTSPDDTNYHWNRRKNNSWLVNSDNLKHANLFRVLDPCTCFQEISMWVGGIIPKNPNPMVEITDDKIKAAKHGFDKLSFRKGKEK